MQKKYGLGFLILIVMITLLPLGTVRAQRATVTVTGTVVGRAGDMKSLAGITLEGPNRYMALTNSEGKFRIGNVTPGRYTVTVAKGNYVQKFNVNIGRNNILDLRVRW